MGTKTKQYLTVTVVGVTLFVALLNFSDVLAFLGRVIDLILPVIVGGILALFINVPMSGIEKRLKKLFRKRKKRPSDKLISVISFFSALVCVVCVLILALTLLIPELVRSFKSLYAQVEEALPRWLGYLEEADTGWLEEWFSDLDWEKIVASFSESFNAIASNAVSALSATVSTVVIAAFGIIIAVYMSLERETLSRHAVKFVRAYLKPAHAESVLKFCRLFHQSFASFLTGQCVEAVILGALMALAFTVFRIPYGILVGMVTAICALVPYVGAFISCCVSVFLVLLIDPMLALRCLIVYMAVQSIENHFIYPHVVGGSVGLPPIYTLIAAMIGGKLFGIIGIIFFIPLTAVIIDLVKESAGKRLGAAAQKEPPEPLEPSEPSEPPEPPEPPEPSEPSEPSEPPET